MQVPSTVDFFDQGKIILDCHQEGMLRFVPSYYAALARPPRPQDRGWISIRDCPTHPYSPIDSFDVCRHCVIIASVALDYSSVAGAAVGS